MTNYIDNLITFIDRQRSMYGAQDEKAPVGPQPVITIDGVDYWHKQEFDLEEITAGEEVLLNVITGEVTDSLPNIRAALNMTGINARAADLVIKTGSPYGYIIYSVEAPWHEANFTSHAFTVVDTQQEVTDETKICLPTCSAYYGYLSEDGKTFISYYNLKEEE